MTLWRLVVKEIRHRKVNFGLGLLSVVVAVGVVAGSVTRLKAHRLRTDEISKKMVELTMEIAKAAKDAARKATLEFNLTIFPKEMDVSSFLLNGTSDKYMPESYVRLLAGDRRVRIINHLEPSISERMKWPERDQREVFLYGVGAEAAGPYFDPKKPFNPRVAEGTVILGYFFHREYALKKGDTMTFRGKSFNVAAVNPQRGNKDDVTLFMNLHDAQKLLGKPGMINAMRAINCQCTKEELPKIPGLLERVLNEYAAKRRMQEPEFAPDVQVIMDKPKAIKRLTLRETAALLRKQALGAEKQQQEDIAAEIESTSATLGPLVIAACGLWLALSMYGNVRARRGEIGILRAMGVRAAHILALFEIKALLIGLVGAVIGLAAGVLVGGAGTEQPLFDRALWGLMLIAAPLLAGVASWLPAMLASRQDPAAILAEE